AALVGTGLVIAAGATTIAVVKMHPLQEYAWQIEDPFDGFEILDRTPPQVAIVPTHFPNVFEGPSASEHDPVHGRAIGIRASIQTMTQIAYNVPRSKRIIWPAAIPTNHFDFIANLRTGARQALREEIRRSFSIAGTFQMI